ncbi:Hypothetical_protein [Hexamita inflata]|uniref:Hypothetical_protein n=1 Tax=Hexamita inflata TaxID=28002 RepID=A0AA86TN61_9EUKA|nr:Hypothetical protein HINF_LOCUS5463 [Hexamita inflata]
MLQVLDFQIRLQKLLKKLQNLHSSSIILSKENIYPIFKQSKYILFNLQTTFIDYSPLLTQKQYAYYTQQKVYALPFIISLKFIPAIQKIVTKITSEINNVSSSAELTQVV